MARNGPQLTDRKETTHGDATEATDREGAG
jgi:hypothetical protein